MLLRLLVVVDAHEENIAGVVGYLFGIILALNLVDGSVGGMIELQFYDECWLADVAARNHHKVGIAFARSVITVNNIPGPRKAGSIIEYSQKLFNADSVLYFLIGRMPVR